MDIGQRLREVRKQYNLSQRQLAAKSGITNGMISMIEQNRASPTVSSLTKILDSLSMSLADFFSVTPSTVDQYVFRADEQIDVSPSNTTHLDAEHSISYRVIGAARAPIEVIHENYEPVSDDHQDLYTHVGFEAGMVVEGEIELTIEDKVHILRAGDGFSFPSTLPHCFRNRGRVRARIVSALTMAG